MKLNDAIALGKKGDWIDVQIRTNPANKKQWYVTLRNQHNKSFILADNNDSPIAMDDMNELGQLIQSMGVNEFTVIL